MRGTSRMVKRRKHMNCLSWNLMSRKKALSGPQGVSNRTAYTRRGNIQSCKLTWAITPKVGSIVIVTLVGFWPRQEMSSQNCFFRKCTVMIGKIRPVLTAFSSLKGLPSEGLNLGGDMDACLRCRRAVRRTPGSRITSCVVITVSRDQGSK